MDSTRGVLYLLKYLTLYLMSSSQYGKGVSYITRNTLSYFSITLRYGTRTGASTFFYILPVLYILCILRPSLWDAFICNDLVGDITLAFSSA